MAREINGQKAENIEHLQNRFEEYTVYVRDGLANLTLLESQLETYGWTEEVLELDIEGDNPDYRNLVKQWTEQRLDLDDEEGELSYVKSQLEDLGVEVEYDESL